MKNKRIARLIAPAVIGIACSLLAFTDYFTAPEGAIFEFLLSRRPAPVPARDILLLEADSASTAEAGRLPWNREILARGLQTLTEMEAFAVVFDASIENETVRERGARDELRAAFDREFTLLKGNVKTLFDAIRLGSVRPKDSAAFVEQLLSLADSSKGRLMDLSGNRERDRELRYEKAIRAFGRVYHAEAPLESGNLPVRRTFARLGLPESQDPLGYALFDAVRERLGNPTLAATDKGLALRGASVPGGDRRDIEIPLDRTGAVLPEPPRGVPGSDFRRLSYETLLRCARLETELVDELRAMERAGYVANAGKDLSPASVYAYSQQVGIESTGEWRALRERFYQSAARFLEGDAEKRILSGYDALLASPTLTPEGQTSLLGLKSAAGNSFTRAREKLSELTGLRATLKKELERSICVVAPALRAPITRVKAAATLADAVLSQRFLRVLPAAAVFAVSAALAAALAAALFFLGVLSALAAGAAAAAAAAAGAAAFFVYSGTWISPIAAALPAAAAAAASTYLALTERGERRRTLIRAFAPRLSAESLKRLTTSHDPRLLDGEKREASIVAVRAKGLSDYHASSDSRQIFAAFRAYHETVGEILKRQGGLLYALEGELVFAAFGAPLPMENHRLRAAKAAVAAAEAETALTAALEDSGVELKPDLVRVGVDSGMCDFGDSGLTGFSGYAAFGPVPVRARLLSSLGERYGCGILITEDVKSGLSGEFETLRLDKLVSKSDGSEDYFYELRRTERGAEATE